MMVIVIVFVLKMTKFWKLERKKMSLFWRAFPTKTLYTLPRASTASPRKKNLAFFKWPQIVLKQVVSLWRI
jgi:hypothetical protein